jgi:SAM-dependent methyltransferase
MRYIKEVFMPQTLDAAKHVALSSDENDIFKFENETACLIDLMTAKDLVRADSRVLDFGCGMGRVSKALIQKFGCTVVGTDMSPNMRYFATAYVNDPRFIALEYPEGVFDLALAVLVLQHVEDPHGEVARIGAAVKSGGTLVLVNEHKRFVPSDVDAQGFVVWNDDGVDIRALLSEYFTHEGDYPYYRREDSPLSLWTRK